MQFESGSALLTEYFHIFAYKKLYCPWFWLGGIICKNDKKFLKMISKNGIMSFVRVITMNLQY